MRAGPGRRRRNQNALPLNAPDTPVHTGPNAARDERQRGRPDVVLPQMPSVQADCVVALVEDATQSLSSADVESGHRCLIGDGWWQRAQWPGGDALAGSV